MTAIVVAFGAEPWLERCVSSLLASDGVQVDVVVVDNGCTDRAVERLESVDGVKVLRPGENLGFAEGCNLGAEAASGAIIAFLNPDTIVDAHALAALAEAASRPDIGIATASVRLSKDPDLLNSAGNPVHFLGMSWAGRMGEPALLHPHEQDVASASGAAMAVEADVWRRLGGFSRLYFAYVEDADLSLRALQQDLRVVYVPAAVVIHRYEFSRNPMKRYLLERNRVVYMLTLYSARTLVLILPAWIVFEIAAFSLAGMQGWLRERVQAWRWLWRNRVALLELRRLRQSERSVPDRVVLSGHTGRFGPGYNRIPPLLEPVNLLIALYWAVVKRLL